MSYNFKPLSDEELESINLLQDGTYNFQVNASTKKISKSGNPMAELQLMIWDNDGKTHLIYDYLVFSNVNLNIKKVAHFCKTTGIEEEYKSGSVREELKGLSGFVEISSKEAQPKPTGGFYPKKNVVVDYVSKVKQQEPIKDDQFIDSDIPF